MAARPEDTNRISFSRESSSYESGSESDDESSSSDEEVMVKPVFLSKTQRGAKSSSTTGDVTGDDIATLETKKKTKTREIALERAENLGTVEVPMGDEDDYDGIDDADDIDPEQEYSEWRVREQRRYERDTEMLRSEERAHEDKVRRENMTEEQLQQDFLQRKAETSSGREDAGKEDFRKGVFFNG